MSYVRTVANKPSGDRIYGTLLYSARENCSVSKSKREEKQEKRKIIHTALSLE